jgi:hypothetical protein
MIIGICRLTKNDKMKTEKKRKTEKTGLRTGKMDRQRTHEEKRIRPERKSKPAKSRM